MKSKTPPPVRATRLRNAKTLTKWRRRTARLRTSAGKAYGNRDRREKTSRSEEPQFAKPEVPARADAQHRNCRAHRCRQDHDHRASAVLHRDDSQDG